MKKGSFLKFLTTILIFTLSFCCVAQEADEKTQLINSNLKYSEFIYKNLLENQSNYQSLVISQQFLTNAEYSSFPFNIIIKKEKTSGKLNSFPESSLNFNEIENLIIVFQQEDMYKNIDSLKNFLTQLDGALLFSDITILISANERNLIKDEYENHPYGSKVFLQDYPDAQTSAAYIFYENSALKQANIIPGAANKISPSWMLKTLFNVMHTSNISYSIPFNFIFLYKTGMMSNNTSLPYYFENELMSCAVEMPVLDKQEFSNFFMNLIQINEIYKEGEWDQHYLYFNFFINELSLIFFYLVFSFVSLAMVSFMIFSNNRKNRKIFIRLRKTRGYAILFFIVSLVILVLLQTILNYFHLSIKNHYILKTILTFSVLIILYFLQVSFNYKISYRATTYYLILATALNLFVFSTLDLSLIFICFIEFVVACACRFTKRKWYQIGIIILMVLPYLPYIYGLIHYTNVNELYVPPTFIKSMGENLLIALLIYPLQLAWSRIALRYNIFLKTNITAKRLIARGFFAVIITDIVILLVLAGCSISSKIVNRYFPVSSSVASILSKDCAEISYTEDSFTSNYSTETYFSIYELSRIKITPKTNINRFNITIETKSSSPIIGSNFEYEFITPSKIVFKIPDNPGNSFDLTFLLNTSEISTLSITAFEEKNGRLCKTEKTLEVKGNISNE